MANFYKNFDSATLMSFGKSFARLNGQPLDKSAIWYSKAEADTYAASASAYVGQPVAVINETDKLTTLYVVGANGTLEMVGSLPDGVSLELHEGKVQLKGFNEAASGAQLRKNADGEIEWFVPSTDTVDGLQSAVGGLQSDMQTAQEDIAAIDETIGLVPEDKTLVEMIADAQAAATYDDTALAGRVTTVEGKAESLQNQIDVIMNNPDTEGVINSIEEFTAYITEHGEVAEGFRTDIDANKKAIEDHETAMAPLIEKLEAIEAGAQVNKIETVSEEFELTDHHLSIKEIAQDKITGLPEALLGKVDKVEGSRLITADEVTKLEKLVLGENGEVSVSGKVAAGNVEGLEAWITARAATLEGLSENSLTDALLEKLNGIEAGAQKNAIEGVSGEFAISADGRVLSIVGVEMEKVVGLPEALAAAGKVDGIKINGTLMDAVDKIVEIKSTDIVKASEEITVAEDGTLGIDKVGVSKLFNDGTTLVLNGGNAEG